MENTEDQTEQANRTLDVEHQLCKANKKIVSLKSTIAQKNKLIARLRSKVANLKKQKEKLASAETSLSVCWP